MNKKCRFSDGQDAFIRGSFLVCTLIYYIGFCGFFWELVLSLLCGASMEIVHISICTQAVNVCIANMQLHAAGQLLSIHISICTQAVSVCIANTQLHNGVLKTRVFVRK